MNKYVELFMLEHDLYEGDLFDLVNKETDEVIMENLMFMDGELTHSGYIPSSTILTQVLDTENRKIVLKKPYPTLKYQPKDKDPYWYIAEGGNIVMTLNYGSESDEWIFDTHHVFRCERHVKDYKAFLLDVALFSQPFKISYSNYYIYYNHDNKKLYKASNRYYQNQGTIYFGDEENLEKFIEEVGEDRIKKYMFDVWN